MGIEVKKVLCVCVCTQLLVVDNPHPWPHQCWPRLSQVTPVSSATFLADWDQMLRHLQLQTPFHALAVSPAARLLCGLFPRGEQDPIIGALRSSSFLVLCLWFAVLHSPLWGCWFQPLICHWVLCAVYNYMYCMYYTFMPGSEIDLFLSELLTNTCILLMGTCKSFWLVYTHCT